MSQPLPVPKPKPPHFHRAVGTEGFANRMTRSVAKGACCLVAPLVQGRG